MADPVVELKQVMEQVGRDFEEFKKENDERLKQVEEKGHVDPLLEEKVNKINEGLTKYDDKLEGLKKEINSAITAMNRGGHVPLDTDKKVAESARKFFEQKAKAQQKPFHEDQVDVDAYKSYRAALDRYFRKDERGLSQDEMKALSVGSDPDGGYWVTPEMSDRISTVVFETSPMRQLATVEQISGSSLEMVIDDDEADAEWVGETQSRDETGTPQIGKLEIVANEIHAKPKATQKSLDDAGRDLEAWLAGKVADRFARKEETAFFTGDGIEKPRGILTFDDGTARKQIQRLKSGVSGSFNGDSFIDVETELKVPYRANATWLLNRKAVGVVRKLKSSDNQYLWQPGLQPGQPNMILGYPMRLAEDLPDVENGALSVAFGDFRTAYTIVERIGIRVLRDPFTAKPFVLFYTTRRVGGNVTTWEAIKLMEIGT